MVLVFCKIFRYCVFFIDFLYLGIINILLMGEFRSSLFLWLKFICLIFVNSLDVI